MKDYSKNCLSKCERYAGKQGVCGAKPLCLLKPMLVQAGTNICLQDTNSAAHDEGWCEEPGTVRMFEWAVGCYSQAGEILELLQKVTMKEFSPIYVDYIKPLCESTDTDGSFINDAAYPEWLILTQRETFRYIVESYGASCSSIALPSLAGSRRECASQKSLGYEGMHQLTEEELSLEYESYSKTACINSGNCVNEACDTYACTFDGCFKPAPAKPCNIFTRVQSCYEAHQSAPGISWTSPQTHSCQPKTEFDSLLQAKTACVGQDDCVGVVASAPCGDKGQEGPFHTCQASATQTESCVHVKQGAADPCVDHTACKSCYLNHQWGIPPSWRTDEQASQEQQTNDFQNCMSCYSLCRQNSCWRRPEGCGENYAPWKNPTEQCDLSESAGLGLLQTQNGSQSNPADLIVSLLAAHLTAGSKSGVGWSCG